MGTQQILLIVLSVIIVGIAVAVGITMFNAQATNSNRQAVMSDLNNLASSALAYYKTPLSHGGGGGAWGSEVDNIGQWLGYDYDVGTNICTTGNGLFTLTSIAGTVLRLDGLGSEQGNDGSTNVAGHLLIDGVTSVITATIDN